MTETQVKVSYALNQVMIKQAKGELGGLGYWIPGYGAGLSGRDALKSVAMLGHNMRFGNYGAAGANALGAVGNTAMAAADFLPFIGPGLRAGVNTARTARTAKGLARLKRLARTNRSLGGHNYLNLVQGINPSWKKLIQTPFASTFGAMHKQTNKLIPEAWKKFIQNKGLSYSKVQGGGFLPAVINDDWGNPYQ